GLQLASPVGARAASPRPVPPHPSVVAVELKGKDSKDAKESKEPEGARRSRRNEGAKEPKERGTVVASSDLLQEVAAALRGQSVRAADPVHAHRLVQLAIGHGVAGLLACAAGCELPPDVSARLTEYTR